jgi:predicted transcriptional regulator
MTGMKIGLKTKMLLEIQKKKSENGKTEITIIERSKDCIERMLVPIHAKFIWETYFSNIKMNKLDWSYLGLDNKTQDITWEVCQ